ncbi:MAG: DUF4384 domain-containing protein [Myxococcus sp.]|nr:DUF4384 domain-containing protein [Myxococcus sp.]
MSEPRPIPDALLERYLAGALTGEALARVERALADSPSERARLDALRADSAAFLISHPPGKIASRLATPRRPRWLWWVPVVAVASAALGVFIVQREAEAEAEATVKGSLVFTAFRQREGGAAEALKPGAVVRPGDRVRFSVRAPGAGFVAVLSRDGAGHASVYYPFAASQPAAHDGNEALLPDAIRLDDVLGAERVWALFSARPFELSPLLRQLERGETPSATGLSTASLMWTKE